MKSISFLLLDPPIKAQGLSGPISRDTAILSLRYPMPQQDTKEYLNHEVAKRTKCSEDRGLKVRFSLAMIVFEAFELILCQMLSSQGKNAPSNPYPHYLVRLASSRNQRGT